MYDIDYSQQGATNVCLGVTSYQKVLEASQPTNKKT